MSNDAFEEGERVYDKETSSYTVVEVLDEVASEVVANEEVTERGYTMYEEQTVADMNPSYPEDDTVVRVKQDSTGNELLWPRSRVVEDIEEAVN